MLMKPIVCPPICGHGPINITTAVNKVTCTLIKFLHCCVCVYISNFDQKQKKTSIWTFASFFNSDGIIQNKRNYVEFSFGVIFSFGNWTWNGDPQNFKQIQLNLNLHPLKFKLPIRPKWKMYWQFSASILLQHR